MKLIVCLLAVLAANCAFARHAFALQSPKQLGEMQSAQMVRLVSKPIWWDASATPAVSYRVYYNGGVIATAFSTTTTLILRPNTTYSIVCTAINADGESAPSNTYIFTTPRKNQLSSATTSTTAQ